MPTTLGDYDILGIHHVNVLTSSGGGTPTIVTTQLSLANGAAFKKDEKTITFEGDGKIAKVFVMQGLDIELKTDRFNSGPTGHDLWLDGRHHGPADRRGRARVLRHRPRHLGRRLWHRSVCVRDQGSRPARASRSKLPPHAAFWAARTHLTSRAATKQASA